MNLFEYEKNILQENFVDYFSFVLVFLVSWLPSHLKFNLTKDAENNKTPEIQRPFWGPDLAYIF